MEWGLLGYGVGTVLGVVLWISLVRSLIFKRLLVYYLRLIEIKDRRQPLSEEYT